MNDQQTAVADFIEKQTQKYADQYVVEETPVEETTTDIEQPNESEKVQQIKQIIADNDFGCADKGVAKICSVILGEEITLPEEEDDDDEDEPQVKLIPFSMIYNGNEEQIVYISDSVNDEQYDTEADVCSSNAPCIKHSRPASRQEIENFISELIKNGDEYFEYLFGAILSVI